MLEGIKIYNLNKNIDERGSFTEIFRKDWNDLFGGDEIVQTNLSISFPGVIRAWHRHKRGQVDYFMTLQGSIKICVYDDESKDLNRIILSSEKIQLVRVPGKYWHGFKSIGNTSAHVVYFVNRLYDYNNPDEERRPWNDATILDPKNKEPFDWNKIDFH